MFVYNMFTIMADRGAHGLRIRFIITYFLLNPVGVLKNRWWLFSPGFRSLYAHFTRGYYC